MSTIIKKFFLFFDPNEYKKLIVLFILMFISMLLETIGIGLIIPMLYAISDPDAIREYGIVKNSFVSDLSNEDIISYFLILMLSSYVIKAIFMTFVAWYRFTFVFQFQANLSFKIFKNYLKQPYLFYLNSNVSDLTQNLIRETNLLTFYFLIPILLVASESLVLLGIISFLFYIEPLGCILLLLIFGVPTYLFNKTTKIKIKKLGRDRQIYESSRLRHAQQGLRAIKEIRLLGRQKFLEDIYSKNNDGLAKIETKENIFQMLPNIWLELFAVIGIIGLAFSIFLKGSDSSHVLSSLGLFFAASIRLIPSLTRIINSWNRIKYSQSSVDILHSELKLSDSCIIENKDASNRFFGKGLSLKNVSFSYQDDLDLVVNKVNLDVHHGDFIILTGSSGSGKSTLINIILGFIKPNQGSVLVDQQNIHDNLRAWQNQIGYVPQNIYMTDDTIRCNIAFGITPNDIDDDAVRKAIASAQLTEFIDSLPDGLSSLLGENGCRLSGGQRQRLGIARALYHSPSILIMDEGTSALDTDTELEIMNMLHTMKEDKTIIMVTHSIRNMKFCDHLYKLEQGKLNENNNRFGNK